MKLSRQLLNCCSVALLAACGPAEQSNQAGMESSARETPTGINMAAAGGETGAVLGDWGVELESRDLQTRPGDDFFQYANGSWAENFEIPPDKSRYGAFDGLSDRSDERIHSIVEDLVDSEPSGGSLEQKIADYYLSFMDTDRLNELGIDPLRPALTEVAAIASRADLIDVLGRARLLASSSPIGFSIGPDRVDPDRNQLRVGVGGISLPDRDYYLLDTERFMEIRNEFVHHVTAMFEFAGFADSAARAQSVLEIESQIAEHLWPRAQRRDRDLTYNPMTYAALKATYGELDWDRFFQAAGVNVTRLEELNVSFPSAMPPIIKMINEVPLEDWKSYLSYQLISNHAGILSEAIDNENFRFYATVLRGIPEQQERWERAVSRVGALNSLGEALGRVYVERYFPESAKQQMEQLVENLRTALAQSINENGWMDEETRQEALLKLDSFRPKIAYPDVWKDLGSIQITRNDLFGNARNVREFFYWDDVNRLGQPTDREEWGMTPQTVNAYYNSSFNEIVFPAGILQPPFFDPAADLAVNYGGIGAVIGHEMGHGFDDQGSKSDYRGIQRDWWTEDARAAFDARTAMLADQYNQFEPVPGNFVDGQFTLGENIGDVGGLSMAYRAYRIALNGEEAPVIDGLTGDQRFYLSWAQVWQAKIREDALISQLKSDPHSPAVYRVNGVVRNQDAWYEAFGVDPGDSLYLAPEERVRIW
ncbi:MAG: M13 family metallopeptidase [Gammaproteobacteria bacterium]|nr:M13 family metallopeptidase [Pseudomonadales bacterium]MCP5347202.1 M13 family metallopeptidase [Pseudomonadales bacterium]